MKKNKTVLFLSFQANRIDIHDIETNISSKKIKEALTGLKFPINIEDINQAEFKFFKYKKDEFIGDSIYTVTIYHKDSLKSLVKKINKLSENTNFTFPLHFKSYMLENRLDGLIMSGVSGVGKTKYASCLAKFSDLNIDTDRDSFFLDRALSFLDSMKVHKEELDLKVTSEDIMNHSFFFGRTGDGKSIFLNQKLSDLCSEIEEKKWNEKLLSNNWTHI